MNLSFNPLSSCPSTPSSFPPPAKKCSLILCLLRVSCVPLRMDLTAVQLGLTRQEHGRAIGFPVSISSPKTGKMAAILVEASPSRHPLYLGTRGFRPPVPQSFQAIKKTFPVYFISFFLSFSLFLEIPEKHGKIRGSNEIRSYLPLRQSKSITAIKKSNFIFAEANRIPRKMSMWSFERRNLGFPRPSVKMVSFLSF